MLRLAEVHAEEPVMPFDKDGKYHYKKKQTFQCAWCEERFETNHSNATTCSSKCRTRCARYRKLTGFEPEEPPGKVTVQVAYKALVTKLLALERARRNNKVQLSLTPTHNRDWIERMQDEEMARKRKDLLGS